MQKKFIKAVFLQFSGIVGTGVFLLPYLFYHSNFYFSAVIMAILSVVMVILNLFYMDVILDTQGDHQLSGYVRLKLGKRFEWLSILNIFILSFGVIMAAIRLSSIFINVLIPPIKPAVAAYIFVAVLVYIHLNRAKFFKKTPPFLSYISLIIMALLFIASFFYPQPQLTDSFPGFSFFGTAVFALAGFDIVPEVEEVLRGLSRKKFLLSFALLFGVMLASVLYLIFTYAVIRISGPKLSVDAVAGVVVNSPILGRIFSIFGLTALFGISLNYLLIIKETLFRDLGFSERRSYLLSLILPLLILCFGKLPFISVISFIGVVTVLVSAFLICLMRLKQSHSFLIKIAVFMLLFTFTFGVFALSREF